jgi:hypothetical protein
VSVQLGADDVASQTIATTGEFKDIIVDGTAGRNDATSMGERA